MTDLIVKRAFLVNGARAEPGTRVSVHHDIAVELVTAGRAEMAGDEPAVSGPMTTESAPSFVKGKRTKKGAY